MILGSVDGLEITQSTAVGGLFGRITVVDPTASSSCGLLRPMVKVTPWYSPSLAVILVTRTSWNSARYCFCCSGVAARQKRPRQNLAIPSTSTSVFRICVMAARLDVAEPGPLTTPTSLSPVDLTNALALSVL